MSKQQKIFRICNLVFMCLQMLTCMGLAIYYGVTKDPHNRLVSSIMMTFVTAAPFLLEMIFRFRLSNLVFLFYQIYSLLAGLIGSSLNVYYLVSWYDTFIHCLAGYVFALLGILVLAKMDNYKKLSPWTIIVFCFAFSMACELVWELIEWSSDLFFNQTAQGIPEEGFSAPFVTDTMEDLLCNFSGGVVFVLQFVIGKFSKFSCGVKFFEKEMVDFYYDKKENNSTEVVNDNQKIMDNENQDKNDNLNINDDKNIKNKEKIEKNDKK